MEKLQMQVESRFGPCYLVAMEQGLTGVYWAEQPVRMAAGAVGATADLLVAAALQIGDYLDGKRQSFDLPLAADGSEFQKKVWRELARIPYGETRSYKDMALAISSRGACRAVGTANGRNPLSIIVPCHRVISSDGSLGGYSGGIAIKRQLLGLEKAGDHVDGSTRTLC